MKHTHNKKPYITYQVRDATTQRLVMLPDNKPLRVAAYTPKAAKHQAKRLAPAAFTLEPIA